MAADFRYADAIVGVACNERLRLIKKYVDSIYRIHHAGIDPGQAKPGMAICNRTGQERLR
jgi:hypothetical protein